MDMDDDVDEQLVNDQLLITLVKARPILYDRQHPLNDHLNKSLRLSLWTEIGRELQTDVQSVKKRWFYLRDYFKKQRRTAFEKAKLGRRKKKWPLNDLMLFLNQNDPNYTPEPKQEIGPDLDLDNRSYDLDPSSTDNIDSTRDDGDLEDGSLDEFISQSITAANERESSVRRRYNAVPSSSSSTYGTRSEVENYRKSVGDSAKLMNGSRDAREPEKRAFISSSSSPWRAQPARKIQKTLRYKNTHMDDNDMSYYDDESIEDSGFRGHDDDILNHSSIEAGNGGAKTKRPDENELFFRSLLPMVKKLKPLDALMFRQDVQGLLIQSIRNRTRTGTSSTSAGEHSGKKHMAGSGSGSAQILNNDNDSVVGALGDREGSIQQVKAENISSSSISSLVNGQGDGGGDDGEEDLEAGSPSASCDKSPTIYQVLS